MSNKICRLCLQTINENYQTIGESLKDVLKLNMDISKEAVKCSECTNNLEVFFKFKLACDIKDINLDPEKIEITDNLISRREVKCCFCRKTSGTEFLTSLNESKEHKFLVNALKEYIPKLNLNDSEELLACETCLDTLQRVLSFVMKCLDVEQRISKYKEIEGTDDGDQLELKDVQQFIFEPIVKYEIESRHVNEFGAIYDQFQEKCGRQAEDDVKYDEIDNPEIFIKPEFIGIKSEDTDCASLQEPSPTIKIDDGSLDIPVLKPEKRHQKPVNQLELIYKNSEGIRVYKCETCSYESKHRQHFNRHTLTHKSTSEAALFKCKLCPYEAKWWEYLKRHELTHKSTSDLKMFKCELCPYEAKRRHYLNQHLLTHKNTSEITMFKCELCSYEAKRVDYLKVHNLVHKSSSDVTMFKCELCSYETKRRDNLKRHELSHKSASERPLELAVFNCDLCPYVAKRRNNLKRHTLTHKSTLEITMFKCEVCPFKTKRRDNLKKHQLTHKRTLS